MSTLKQVLPAADVCSSSSSSATNGNCAGNNGIECICSVMLKRLVSVSVVQLVLIDMPILKLVTAQRALCLTGESGCARLA